MTILNNVTNLFAIKHVRGFLVGQFPNLSFVSLYNICMFFYNQIIVSSLKTNAHVNGHYSSNDLNLGPFTIKGANAGGDCA
jgi:hypothetical protein